MDAASNWGSSLTELRPPKRGLNGSYSCPTGGSIPIGLLVTSTWVLWITAYIFGGSSVDKGKFVVIVINKENQFFR